MPIRYLGQGEGRLPVGQKELGQRVQDAREACRLIQEEMAHHLRVSCSTVIQMELGNRAITSLEFERIAYLFGRDMWEFFAEEFHEEDPLLTRFRAYPDVAGQTDVVDTLRRCLVLGREVTNLECLLGIDWHLGAIAAHHCGVSLLAALYRSDILGFIMETELGRLKAQEATGRYKEVAPFSGPPKPYHEAAWDEFLRRFLNLALEAVRQGAITRAKLQELARMVGLGPEPLTLLLCDMGLDDREEAGDVLSPEA
jgi:transcriptional regulator with XRE-family HTH domain